MAIPHAEPGEIVDVRPLGPELSGAKTTTLVKTDALEMIRLVVPAGKEIPTHHAPGEMVLQCLEGSIAFTALGQTRELRPGDLVYLSAREPHAVRGIEDASLLLTILLHAKESAPEDAVEEASEESFPASDPPSWTGVTRP